MSGFVKKQPFPILIQLKRIYRVLSTPDSHLRLCTSSHHRNRLHPIHGQILGNYESGRTRLIANQRHIPQMARSQVVFTTEQFTILEKGCPSATSVEMPYRITSSLKGGV